MIFVKFLTGRTITIDVDADRDTVGDLKRRIGKKENRDPKGFQLFYTGFLKNTDNLRDAGILGETIRVIEKPGVNRFSELTTQAFPLHKCKKMMETIPLADLIEFAKENDIGIDASVASFNHVCEHIHETLRSRGTTERKS